MRDGSPDTLRGRQLAACRNPVTLGVQGFLNVDGC